MSLIDLRVRDLLAAFRSSEPTPGGGSASALAGAIGAALLAMVAGIPKPRASSEAELRRLKQAGDRCAVLADELLEMVDRDSEAYNAVMSAYRRPKATGEEKASRVAAIQEGLRAATEAPLDVMRRSRAALDQSPTIGELGNANASSDVRVAQALLQAALHGARLNVEVNLGSVKDQEYATAAAAEVARLTRPS